MRVSSPHSPTYYFPPTKHTPKSVCITRVPKFRADSIVYKFKLESQFMTTGHSHSNRLWCVYHTFLVCEKHGLYFKKLEK